MGMTPFLEDLKWRAVNWHYEFYMKEKAEKALKANQGSAAKLQWVADMKQNGESLKGLCRDEESLGRSIATNQTRHFHFKTFIPNIIPNFKSTNPFCPQTPNKTGWREVVTRRISDPLPRGKHFVSGTDDSVPLHPKVR